MHVKIYIDEDSKHSIKTVRARGLETVSQLSVFFLWLSSPLSKASVEVSVEVIFLTELVCQRYARKQLAPFTLDWIHIEKHHKAREDSQKKCEGDQYLAALAVCVHSAKADVRQECEGEEEA